MTLFKKKTAIRPESPKTDSAIQHRDNESEIRRCHASYRSFLELAPRQALWMLLLKNRETPCESTIKVITEFCSSFYLFNFRIDEATNLREALKQIEDKLTCVQEACSALISFALSENKPDLAIALTLAISAPVDTQLPLESKCWEPLTEHIKSADEKEKYYLSKKLLFIGQISGHGDKVASTFIDYLKELGEFEQWKHTLIISNLTQPLEVFLPDSPTKEEIETTIKQSITHFESTRGPYFQDETFPIELRRRLFCEQRFEDLGLGTLFGIVEDAPFYVKEAFSSALLDYISKLNPDAENLNNILIQYKQASKFNSNKEIACWADVVLKSELHLTDPKIAAELLSTPINGKIPLQIYLENRKYYHDINTFYFLYNTAFCESLLKKIPNLGKIVAETTLTSYKFGYPVRVAQEDFLRNHAPQLLPEFIDVVTDLLAEETKTLLQEDLLKDDHVAEAFAVKLAAKVNLEKVLRHKEIFNFLLDAPKAATIFFSQIYLRISKTPPDNREWINAITATLISHLQRLKDERPLTLDEEKLAKNYFNFTEKSALDIYDYFHLESQKNYEGLKPFIPGLGTKISRFIKSLVNKEASPKAAYVHTGEFLQDHGEIKVQAAAAAPPKKAIPAATKKIKKAPKPNPALLAENRKNEAKLAEMLAKEAPQAFIHFLEDVNPELAQAATTKAKELEKVHAKEKDETIKKAKAVLAARAKAKTSGPAQPVVAPAANPTLELPDAGNAPLVSAFEVEADASGKTRKELKQNALTKE